MEEDNIHIIEDMVYLPPMRNINWFVKEKYQKHISKFHQHKSDIYVTSFFRELP